MNPTLYLTCLLSALLLLPHRGLAEPESTIVCLYDSKKVGPDGEFYRREKCAYLRGDQIVVSSAARSKMDFSKKGLAAIVAHDYGWLYVRRDGSTIRAGQLDAGIDPFLSGRARYIDHGKMGFINESGNIVIPARYTAACVFNYGYAMVNNGGHEVVIDEQDSVHSTEGGRWGCIDTKGKEVIPVEYSYEEARQKLKALDRRAFEKDELEDKAKQDFQRSKH